MHFTLSARPQASRAVMAAAAKKPGYLMRQEKRGQEENARRGIRGEAPAPVRHNSGTSSYSGSGSYSGSSAPRRVQPSAQVQKRQSMDYSSRRSGSSEGRRSSSYSPAARSSSDYGSGSRGSGPKPAAHILKRQSIDYSARRSGSSEGRRSSSYSPAPAARSSSDYGSGSRSGSGPKPAPHILKRQSIDYSARRSGSSEGRRSSSYSPAPASRSSSDYGSGSRSSNGPKPAAHILKRQSIDYSARRSGSSEGRRSSSYSSNGSSSRPRPSAATVRRQSMDYSARRSGSDAENQRRGIRR